jgi:hypothetical protein
MLITKESLSKFRDIYSIEFSEELSDEDADRKARFLLNLFTAIYRSPVELIREDNTNLDIV